MPIEDYFNNPAYNLSAKGVVRSFNKFTYNSQFYDPRTLIIGDSHLQMGWNQTSAGICTGFTVSGGLATITFSGNHYILPGNKFTLYDTTNNGGTGNLNTTIMSGAQFTALTVATVAGSNQITFNATVNGVTPANGNYLSLGQWQFLSHTAGKDSTFLHWINAFNGAPFNIVYNYTLTGSSSTNHLSYLTKIQGQAPRSSYSNVVISFGTNGLLNQSVLGTAIGLAEIEYKNIMTLADSLYSTGIVYIVIPIGGSAGVGNKDIFTRTIAYLRRRLLQTIRPYRLKFFDIFGMSINGASQATGYDAVISHLLDSYQYQANHLSVYGSFKIAKQETIWDTRLGWDMPSRMIWKPVTFFDDNLNVPNLWANNTTYNVNDVVMNNYAAYQCVNAGRSSLTGTSGLAGPTGNATNIPDNVARWNYLGIVPVNLAQNGLMSGTVSLASWQAGSNTPTNWSVSSVGSNISVASSSSRGNSAIIVKPTDAEAIPGYGWDLSIVSSGGPGSGGTDADVVLYQNTPMRLKPSTWYQARMTVTGKNAINTILKKVELKIQVGFTGVSLYQVQAHNQGNNTNIDVGAIPLATTDTYEVITPPFYVPDSLPISNTSDNQISITIGLQGAGTANVQISNFVYSPIRDPNLYPGLS